MRHLAPIVLIAASLVAQDEPATTPAERTEALQRLVTALRDGYLDADRGAATADAIEREAAAGHLDQGDARAFVQALNRTIATVAADRHLRVELVPANDRALDDAARERRASRERERRNHGFVALEILPGNVGYLRLDGFDHPRIARPTAEAAMRWLAHADALILDVRSNTGGSGDAVLMLASWLFDAPTHLFTEIDRDGVRVERTTSAAVAGTSRPSVPVFVLTSRRTFSAGEGFAFALQSAGRATVVGERTAGGSHPGAAEPLGERFRVFVPRGRVVCPPDDRDWEGVGVVPDVPCAAERALDAAHARALTALIATEGDPDVQRDMRWHLASVAAAADPPAVATDRLARLAGRYGERVVRLEENELWYRRGDNEPARLLPLADGSFGFAEVEHFRVRFEERDGEVVALVGVFADGTEQRFARDAQ